MHVVCVGDYPQAWHQIGGGVEAVVLYLTQALQQQPDLQIEVVTLARRGQDARTEQQGGVTVHYLPASTAPSRFSVVANIRQLRATITRLQPDLVHAHIASEYGWAAATSGRPWVLTLHGIRHLEAALQPGLRNRYRQWFTKQDELRLVRQAPQLIAISPFVQTVFARQIQGQVHLIENPVAAAFFTLPAQPQRHQLLYAGRLIPRKDILTLLRAFALVRQHLPTATLRLAGGNVGQYDQGRYQQQIRDLIDQADLRQAVCFLGELDETALLAEYAACQALVLASTLETAPMVIMQAMAAGKPVVSTDAGGVRYLVEQGQTGYVTPIGDSKALAKAILQTLQCEESLTVMGQRAKAAAEQRFRAEVVAAQTRQVYETMLTAGHQHVGGYHRE